jgi:hypothetical protein
MRGLHSERIAQIHRPSGRVTRPNVEIAVVKVLVDRRWVLVLAVVQIRRRTEVRVGIITRTTVADNGTPLATSREAFGESTLRFTTSSSA